MRSLFAAAFALVFSSTALASSHREAPFITKNPKVDNTDFYMFNSYETGRAGFVTLISNFQPLQHPYGGPNYFTMDPEALYEIHVENSGDSVEDITFQFRFQNVLSNGGLGVALPIARPDGGGFFPTADGGVSLIPIPLINAGPLGQSDGGFARTTGFQGLQEQYQVRVIRGPRRATAGDLVPNPAGGNTFEKPMDNVGPKTFPGNSYANYANSFLYTVNIPGCAVPAKMFVGSRKEGFAVNLGTIFDLVNAPAAVITDPTLRDAGLPNTISQMNVTTIALEVSASCLTAAGGGTVLGGWSTASLRQARVLNPTARYDAPSREGGAWVQVSRLGNPLVNEVVIGLPDKDKFNSSEPKDDVANFAKYVFNPTLPALIEILFSAPAPRAIPRNDLVTAFLTGVAPVNANGATSEMLRLQTNVAVVGPATPAANQNDLGALDCFVRSQSAPAALMTMNPGCDPHGFPNGRRPGDDVVDIALRVAMGYLLSTDDAPAGGVPFHDAIKQHSSDFDAVFPYLKTPNAGTYP
ncbi:MAG: DUF4331 domain-containing protein [Myxococcaceae bacterium]|nr:DUF4331 domain-containing protein [Myxococcaceae bacterium]